MVSAVLRLSSKFLTKEPQGSHQAFVSLYKGTVDNFQIKGENV
jgi:hypothetical protein